MIKTNTLTETVCSVAMLALAALPIAALSTAANAATVKVSDLNLNTSAGVAAFEARAERAAWQFCANERSVSAIQACRAGVAAELAQKMDVVRTAQASKSATFAAR